MFTLLLDRHVCTVCEKDVDNLMWCCLLKTNTECNQIYVKDDPDERFSNTSFNDGMKVCNGEMTATIQ